ncbi:MAG: hypothetical protein ACR2KC_04145 [Acidimicrobiales bacterium]
MTRSSDPAAAKWTGPTRRYDLVKEFVAATVVVAVLVVMLAVLFGSPDEKAVTLQQWAKAVPGNFVGTAAKELDATSTTANYGAPYNHTPGAGQKLGPLPLARWGGVREPVDTVNDFVIGPLRAVPNDAALTQALQSWTAAGAEQDQKWASAYDDAIAATPNETISAVKPGDYGPVPVLLDRLLSLGQTGAMDGALTRGGGFYAGDYTKPLLFLADGTYLSGIAQDQHLAGNQWGMMNETGSFPGQAWLWLYTFWYQISPFNHSGNGDALVWGMMALLTLVFILVPFVPGLRDLPRYLGVHKLIWRQWYRASADQRARDA